MQDVDREATRDLEEERELEVRRRRSRITFWVVFVIPIVAVLVITVSARLGGTADPDKYPRPDGTSDSFGVLPAPTSGPAGNSSSAVRIEIYEDFQCPGCRALERSARTFLDAQASLGKVIVVDHPFSILDEVGHSPNRYSHRATNAALCVLDAAGPEAYAGMRDALFAAQPDEGRDGPSNASLARSAESVGVPTASACITGETYVPWIDEARKAGFARGVTGTPTVFVNGRMRDIKNKGDFARVIKEAQS
ncbi:hypothetical protein ASD11_14320 [Aeromicrobium sp. Root495]|uniref:DsbA family protein n=1 Tax=Aeromicrobium sp. Root495 TaxID=1736550 RepID=UPI0006FF57A0|nr:thioredoxin domain-containing protein [Aeromicrobium sp. Root495]KQY55687.1 hypothetical protein ASD11_14320 [Aeromicrobium sp. Root495]